VTQQNNVENCDWFVLNFTVHWERLSLICHMLI